MTLATKQASFGKITRETLRSQVANMLREKIISGELAAGTKVTERDVSELLEVSRMPARDALMELEKEGLLDNRPSGRYIVELDSDDIRQLFKVREVLEKTAIELAIAHLTDEDGGRLKAGLTRMGESIQNSDFVSYIKSDIELHQLIWDCSRNHYLAEMLRSISGVISVFMANHAKLESWETVYELHEDIVNAILSKDSDSAIRNFEKHTAQSLRLSLELAHALAVKE